jgi:cyclic beta-1,2-glucan synthetase
MNHIRRIATKEGLVEICEGTIRVLRWGLWMAPVIFTFLRQMPDPTWYNQDGAFNTLLGIVMSATLSVSEFTSWRLDVFMLSMAHDSLRILTWLDHMGLRVATLVNLSFIGMEALDALMLRFTRAPQGVKNFIPEGVKRFATWAPLLIPFYIPKGKDWDVAWDTSVDIQSRSSSVWMEFLQQPVGGLLLYALGICLLLTFCLMVMRVLTNKAIVLKNEGYRVKFDQKKQRLHSSLIWQNIHLAHKEDLPRTLTIFEKGQSAWKLFGAGVTGTQVEKKKDHIVIQRESSTVNVRLEIHLPVRKDSVESWSISVKNKSSEKQVVAVAPYIEWGLDAPMNLNDHKRNVFYSAGSNAIYAEHPESGKFGFMASKFPPKGILMSKVNEMNTDQFSPPTSTKKDGEEAAVGSLLMEIELEAGEEKSIQVLMGCGHYEAEVVNFVKSYLRPKS